jgi:hypothetical protein
MDIKALTFPLAAAISAGDLYSALASSAAEETRLRFFLVHCADTDADADGIVCEIEDAPQLLCAK